VIAGRATPAVVLDALHDAERLASLLHQRAQEQTANAVA
jgi:hypothetical protein